MPIDIVEEINELKNLGTVHPEILNLIEKLCQEILRLREENQRLRDEINRLKGEQGKPTIKASRPAQAKDISSEKERSLNKGKKKHRKNKKQSKKQRLPIHEPVKVHYDKEKEKLPPDAEFKGYSETFIQDIMLNPHNILIQRETYYSKSERRTYTARMPAGYEGGYGPNLKAFILMLKYESNTSEPAIHRLLTTLGIEISLATISNLLIKNKEDFYKEKEEMFVAGLSSTEWQQIDDTHARVDGSNWYTHVICNPLYTSYFTCKRKNRLTIIELLLTGKSNNGLELNYCFNDETFSLLEKFCVSENIIKKLKSQKPPAQLRKPELEEYLKTHVSELSATGKNKVLEACAISAYHMVSDYPVIKILLCDDAPQFKLITELLSLCWIHEGRHYKKLTPVIPLHQKILKRFIKKYWKYYRKLLIYKNHPNKQSAIELATEFDELFSTKTGYTDLDERIEKTLKKKEHLLLVLKYPQLPLHNNESELAARISVRKRDVSLHMKNEDGIKAQDTFLSIVQTCKKLGINFLHYLQDRIRKINKIPQLHKIIFEMKIP